MFEIDKKRFGSFVAMLRKEKGYTQKELAEKLFISDKAVSKWETAASIPDTTLLIPLAELLGVTVTELLMCERMERNISMDAEQVEGVVKTALAYSEEDAGRAYQTKSRWPAVYLCSVVIGAAGMLLNYQHGALGATLLTAVILCAIFGAYFCFFVKTKLPVFYDENRCGLYYDGVFRMNVPGVAFNNSNWPHIVRSTRIWACMTVAFFPIINFIMTVLIGEMWLRLELFVFLTLLLGGLFAPIYIIGKKYE